MNSLRRSLIMEGTLQRVIIRPMPVIKVASGCVMMTCQSQSSRKARCCMIKRTFSSTNSCNLYLVLSSCTNWFNNEKKRLGNIFLYMYKKSSIDNRCKYRSKRCRGREPIISHNSEEQFCVRVDVRKKSRCRCSKIPSPPPHPRAPPFFLLGFYRTEDCILYS